MFLKIIKEYLVLAIGGLIVAFSINIFLLPLNMIPGGTAGIAMMLHKLYKTPLWISSFLLNIIPVLIIIIIDKKNAIKTLYVISIISVVMKLTEPYSNIIIASSENLQEVLRNRVEDLFISMVFGAILLGYGVGIVINNGGTTGGSATLAALLQKIFKRVKLTSIMFITELCIIGTGIIIFKDIKMGLFYFLTLFIVILCIEKFIIGVSLNENLYIITNKYSSRKIFFYLISLNLDANIINSRGLYTEEEERLILCFVPIELISKVKNEIQSIDSSAKIISVPSKEIV